MGIGKSTLGKWIARYRTADVVIAPQADLARENERLRLENRILKEERDTIPQLPAPAFDEHKNTIGNLLVVFFGGGCFLSLNSKNLACLA